jgi:hypothetical protein
MVLTTEFEISSAGASPVSTGRTILFPFSAGEFSGVKEFYTDSDNAANAADSLTETQDRYIVGAVTNIKVSQNFNLGLFNTDKERNSVWVYKYLWDETKRIQSAWSKWIFTDKVEYFFFRNSLVYLVTTDTAGRVHLSSLDLNRPLGEYGYHLMLDRQRVLAAFAGTVTLPYLNARFQQGEGCSQPGTEAGVQSVISLANNQYRYVLDLAEVPNGATVRAGQEILWQLTPTEVFARDYQNNIDTSRKVTVQDYVVHVDQSGVFKAVGTSPYSPPWEFYSDVFPLDNEPDDPSRLMLYSGPVFFPWGERADWSTVTFEGTDIRPVTIHEVGWTGQITQTKGRRV